MPFSIRVTPIIPKEGIPDAKKVMKAIERTMRFKTKKDLRKDFGETVKSWDDKPRFADSFAKYPNQYVLSVFPAGELADQYAWISNGTKPRVIVPQKDGGRLKFRGGPYVSKTRPGVIGSARGGPTGKFVYPKMVVHPGIKPRKFDEMIAAHNERTFQKDIQNAINDAVN